MEPQELIDLKLRDGIEKSYADDLGTDGRGRFWKLRVWRDGTPYSSDSCQQHKRVVRKKPGRDSGDYRGGLFGEQSQRTSQIWCRALPQRVENTMTTVSSTVGSWYSHHILQYSTAPGWR